MSKHHFRKIPCALLCIALLFSLGACKSSGGQKDPAATPGGAPAPAATDSEKPSNAGEVITLRFSGANGEGDVHTDGIKKVKEELERLSGGTMKLDLYLNSTLYSQDAETEALMSGDLDLCYTSSQWIANYVDEANMFTAMYLYNDVDQLNAVLNGEIGKELFQTVSDQIGVFPLAAYYYGARDCLMRSNAKEYKTPEDMKGIVMREPNTEAWLFVGEALGASPVPLAFGEMYTALQTGTIDAVENPLPTILNNKLYEVCGQVVMTDHILDSVWPTISTERWESLTEEQQGWLLEAIEAGRVVTETAMLEQEKEAVAQLEGFGLKVVYPDIDAFRAYSLEKYKASGQTDSWDMDLYNKIQSLG